jgi:hypothetical protein
MFNACSASYLRRRSDVQLTLHINIYPSPNSSTNKCWMTLRRCEHDAERILLLSQVLLLSFLPLLSFTSLFAIRYSAFVIRSPILHRWTLTCIRLLQFALHPLIFSLDRFEDFLRFFIIHIFLSGRLLLFLLLLLLL